MFLNTMWNKKCKTSASWLYTWAASHINSGQPNTNIRLPQETRFYCSMTSKTPQQRPDLTVWTNGCRLHTSSNAGALHDLRLKGVCFNRYGCAPNGKLIFLMVKQMETNCSYIYPTSAPPNPISTHGNNLLIWSLFLFLMQKFCCHLTLKLK